MSNSLVGLLVASTLILVGCRSVGPATVPRDRFDYSAAITESWKRQTLLNIVKLRYFDPPIFVDVGQIVSGYSLETGATVGGSILSGASGDILDLQGTARFTDRPTVTYVPLTGTKFVAGLMTPVPPESLFFSIQAGWPADVMLRLGVASINGLRNEDNTLGNQRPADPRFVRMAELMRAVQASGALSIRVTKGATAAEQATIVTFRAADMPADVSAQVRELTDLLGLAPDRKEYRLAFGSIATDTAEVAVLTRSLLHVINSMALRAEVPAVHVSAGRASPAPPDVPATQPAGVNVRSPFVRCTSERPSDAFVAVRYREHWFWIDDRDLSAKRDFAFIMLLFTLGDTGTEQGLPLITIPAQ